MSAKTYLLWVWEATYVYLESVQGRGNDDNGACISIGVQITRSAELRIFYDKNACSLNHPLTHSHSLTHSMEQSPS